MGRQVFFADRFKCRRGPRTVAVPADAGTMPGSLLRTKFNAADCCSRVPHILILDKAGLRSKPMTVSILRGVTATAINNPRRRFQGLCRLRGGRRLLRRTVPVHCPPPPLIHLPLTHGQVRSDFSVATARPSSLSPQFTANPAPQIKLVALSDGSASAGASRIVRGYYGRSKQAESI